MATQAVTSGAEVVNGATVVYGGAIDGINVTNAPGINHVTRSHRSKNNDPVVTTGSAYRPGIQKALTAGTFAYENTGNTYIGKRVSTTINGVANDFLLSGGGKQGPRSSIHYLLSGRRLHETSWDYVTGAVTKGGNAGDSFNYVNPVGGGTATDSAAQPTRAIPGELVYTDHSLAKSGQFAIPLYADYAERTD